MYYIRFVPCIKDGEREQTSFLSFFNVRTKGDSLLPCEDIEIEQIGSKASPDQATYPLVLFLRVLSSRDMRDNIVPFVVYGSMSCFVITAKIDKDPLSLCTMEHSHADGSAHLLQ
jgi:hypothetical protein